MHVTVGRDGDKVKNRTLANLSDWLAEQIETLRAALRGDRLVPAGEGMEIVRVLSHGPCRMARQIGWMNFCPTDRSVSATSRWP